MPKKPRPDPITRRIMLLERVVLRQQRLLNGALEQVDEQAQEIAEIQTALWSVKKKAQPGKARK